MNHRVGQFIFAAVVGILIAVFSYHWITNPQGRAERAVEVEVVRTSQSHLMDVISSSAIEIVDPLEPNRKVGKVYVYPEEDGWSVSGYYRRGDDDPWHPFLMTLGSQLELTSLKIKDAMPELAERAEQDPLIEISR